MFRELARKKQEISRQECLELLSSETRGVLAVNGDGGYPYATPINHFYSSEDGCIYFHCGRSGHRLDSLLASDKVSFCVMEKGHRNEGEWAYNVRSVVVFGNIEIIDNIETVTRICTLLSRKFTSDEDYIKNEIEKYGKATLLLKLTPAHISGKRVREE